MKDEANRPPRRGFFSWRLDGLFRPLLWCRPRRTESAATKPDSGQLEMRHFFLVLLVRVGSWENLTEAPPATVGVDSRNPLPEHLGRLRRRCARFGRPTGLDAYKPENWTRRDEY